MIRRCFGAMSHLCRGDVALQYRLAGGTPAWLCDACRDVAEAHGMDPRPIEEPRGEPEWTRQARERALPGKVWT